MKKISLSAVVATLLLCFTSIHAQKYKVIIRVLTHEGKPLRQSHATLAHHEVGTRTSLPARKINDHTFEFIPASAGVYTVRVAGLHHRAFGGPIILDKDSLTVLDARLGTFSPELKTPDSVFISGSFNSFSMEEGMIKMAAQRNGSFTAFIPAQKGSVYYRPVVFINGDGIPVDAPHEKIFEYDSNRFTVWGGGNYYSVVTSGRSAKVTFNPQSVLTSDLPAVVKFSDPSSTTASLLTAYMDVDFRLMKFRQASYNFLETRQMGDFDDFLKSYKVVEDLSYFSDMRLKVSDTGARDLYALAAFHLNPKDPVGAVQTLLELSPRSPVWKVGYNWTRHFLNALPNRKEAASFAERVAASQSSAALRSEYLSFALEVYFKEDETSFIRLYNTIMKEFEMWPEFLETVKRRNPIDRKILVGKTIPDFSFLSMDDPNQVISPSRLQGKTYLIDLWATWCAPCVAELKNVHRVYHKFADKGFTVVSISFDTSPETVAAFRQKKWNMPWYHAFAGEGQEAWKKFGALFELQGIPRAILVSKEGVIIGIDEQLKGENLDMLLEAEIR